MEEIKKSSQKIKDEEKIEYIKKIIDHNYLAIANKDMYKRIINDIPVNPL